MSNKKIVVVSPQNVKKHLSTDEWHSLIKVVDKLLSLDIELCLSYHEIISQKDQLPT